MKSLLTLLLVAGGLMFVLGCPPREHMRADWGQATKARFVKQQVYLQPAEGGTGGLDSEEAAAINAAYRRQLGGQQGGEAASQVLVLEDPKQKK